MICHELLCRWPKKKKLTPLTTAGLHHMKSLERRAPRMGGPGSSSYNLAVSNKSAIESPIRAPRPGLRLMILVLSYFYTFVCRWFDKPQNVYSNPRRALKKKNQMIEWTETSTIGSCISTHPSSDMSGVINAIRGPSKPTSERPGPEVSRYRMYIASGYSHIPVE